MADEKGYREDNGKLRYDLISGAALEKLASVCTFGASKYPERNWEKGMKFTRCFASIMRHCWARFRGEILDTESGLPHMAHAMWNCMAIVHYDSYGIYKTYDDFPKYGHPEVPMFVTGSKVFNFKEEQISRPASAAKPSE